MCVHDYMVLNMCQHYIHTLHRNTYIIMIFILWSVVSQDFTLLFIHLDKLLYNEQRIKMQLVINHLVFCYCAFIKISPVKRRYTSFKIYPAINHV